MRYKTYVDIFSKVRAVTLAPHWPIDHPIDLEPDFNLPYGWIHNLVEIKLKTLEALIETNLANGFFLRSSPAAAAPNLFAKRKDGGLRLCVDFRALTKASVKNIYTPPLSTEMLDRLRGAQIFTKLDVRDAYHLIRIKEGDEYKPGFHSRYGQIEYRVMVFGLTNPPATV